LRHPAVVAEGVAAIRDVWGDRIELGLGLGHRSNVTDEFGLPYEASPNYLQEYAEAIRHLLNGESYTGQHLRSKLALQRRRATRGSPPILIAALGPKAVDRAASYADGTPMAADASSHMDWSQALAFQGAQLEISPTTAAYSDIDGHQVNSPERRQPLGAFTLFNFSAKIDPVATMLVQNHRDVIPDFYGLTTSFRRDRLKPSVSVLADETNAPWVKLVHGERGQGTWTYYGGHDPEDPQHQIGDPPTDLSLHPHSPGYRLILNNVLFPAAKKKELKT